MRSCIYLHIIEELDSLKREDSNRKIEKIKELFEITIDYLTRYIDMPEEGLYRISYGGVLQWGFDYAFSLDKEKLKEDTKVKEKQIASKSSK